ncbi:MAG: AAA family ATPase [Planctomycetes bacterium]|nr:AAA family ATPase [Planctomycetota bacterium]
MYAEFFGLRELPFNNTPDPRFFFSTPDHEEALASLVYAVQERKGFVLLTGEVGAGKTLVSRMMLIHFGPRIAFAGIHHAIQSGSDLLEALCSEFQLPVEQGASQNTLIHTLHDFLLAEFSKDVPVVLVLDEAQALTVDAFEQLRMIGNLEADGAKLLQIVILGQPELQQRFSSPEFRQLRQRIFRTFHLPAMTRNLTEEYIRHRLTIAGAPHTDFFDRPAIDRIYKHSNGLPRLINTICDNAMLGAYSANCRRMDDEFIENSVAHMMSLGSDHRSREEGPTNTTQPAAGPSPLSRAAGLAGASVNASECDPAGTVISLLSRRIAELEERLDNSRTAPQPGAPNAFIGNDGRGTTELQQDVHRVAAELARTADQVSQQRSGAVQTMGGLSTTIAQAQAADVRLKPLVHQAIVLAEKIRAENSTRAKEEARFTRMAATSRAVMTKVRTIFEDLKRAATKAQRVEKRAQAASERLALLCDVAARQSSLDEATAVADARPASPAPSRTVSIKQKTAPAKHVVGAAPRPSVADDCLTLQESLGRSRTSLTELRMLVRETGDERSVAAAVDGQLEEKGGVLRPTVRLATQVERLLTQVSGTQH